MSKRPVIPRKLRELPPPSGFENPFAMGIRGPHLFATETLCGDWDGDLLLLAQDFAPAADVETVLDYYGPEAAWRHNDGDGRYVVGRDTNPTICALLRSIGRNISIDGGNSARCGVLYGNACFFLTSGGAMDEGIAASKPVFEFVTRKMKRLKTIACLGRASFEGVMQFFGLSADWPSHRYAQRQVSAGEWLVYGLAHPGYWGSRARSPGGTKAQRLAAMQTDWQKMARGLDRAAMKNPSRKGPKRGAPLKDQPKSYPSQGL